jgi:aldose 1-epimerase
VVVEVQKCFIHIQLGTILEHELQLNAERYLPVDSTLIPTGELKEVKGTEMDFTTSHSIGSFISKVEGGGYDHCYQLHDQSHNKLSKAAR